MADKYDLIFSLGSFPLVSQMLKECDLQFFEFPFDILLKSDFYTRMNLFMNNCKDFLNELDIKYNKDQNENIIIRNTRHNFEYTELDFNVNLPLENNFPGVKTKYDKYIKTLYLCLKRAKRILIVYVENPSNVEDDTETSVLIGQSVDLLKNKYPDKEFHIIYIRNEENSPDMQVIQIGEWAEKFKFSFAKRISEVSQYYIDVETLKIVLSDIKLKTTFSQKKILLAQKISAKLINIIESS